MTHLLHQSLTDLRRHRLLVAAWLVVLALQVVVVAYPFGVRFSGLGNSLLGTSSVALGVAHFALVIVLAVLIVQGDSPATTTAFWLTRPTGRGMMAAGKAATAVAVLVVAPALADTTAAAANRLPGPDVALVALFSAADHAAVVFSAMAVAAVTADLSGFALTAVGLLIASFAGNLLARLSAFAGRTQLAPFPFRPAWLEVIGPFALAGIVVFAVQYLRPTRRLALSALVVAVLLSPAALRLWHVDWSSREPALDTQVLNPGDVTVTMPGSGPSVWLPHAAVRRGGSHTLRPDRDVVLVDTYLAAALPQAKILVAPVSIDARLDIAGNGTVRYREEADHGRRPYSLPLFERRARQQIAAALAPSRLARDWGGVSSPDSRMTLVSLTEAQRAKAARDGAVYRAEVLLQATLFETSSPVPLRRGASGRAADRGFTVLDARCDQESCRVVIRDVAATFQPDPRGMSNVTYVLRNRRLGVTLMASPWADSRLESAAYVPTPQHLAVAHRDLQFGEYAGATVKTDESWLTDGEIVALVARDLGVFTRPLVIPDFGAMLARAEDARVKAEKAAEQ